jgi:hypothetical protein
MTERISDERLARLAALVARDIGEYAGNNESDLALALRELQERRAADAKAEDDLAHEIAYSREPGDD